MSEPEQPRLTRRDFFIIPALCLFTVVAMCAVVEGLARITFAEIVPSTCSVTDKLHHYRFKPNCDVQGKSPESPVVRYEYNNCGYRTREPCDARPDGIDRVAVLGSSTAEGMNVDYDDAFAPRLSKTLGEICGRQIQFQNLGVPGYSLIDSYVQADEVLALRPNLAIFVISPYDLRPRISPEIIANRDIPAKLETLINPEIKPSNVRADFISALHELVSDSRALLVIQHFMLADPEVLIASTLKRGDDADYLRAPFNPAWLERVDNLSVILGGLSVKFHAAGVPFAVVLGPQLVQVALDPQRAAKWGLDPFAIGRAIQAIAQSDNFAFIDTLPEFQAQDDPKRLYYLRDGHLNAQGHGILANAVLKGLAGTNMIDALPGCSGQKFVSKN